MYSGRASAVGHARRVSSPRPRRGFPQGECMPKTAAPSTCAVLALALALAVPVHSAQPKEPVRDLDVKAFFVPELAITSSHVELEAVLSGLPNREAWETFLAGGREGFANPA